MLRKNKKGSIVFLPEELLLVISLLFIALIVLMVLNIITLTSEHATVQIDATAKDFPVPKTCDTNLMNLLQFEIPRADSTIVPSGLSTAIEFTYADAIAYSQSDPDYLDSAIRQNITLLLDTIYGVDKWGFEVYVKDLEPLLSFGLAPSRNTFECVAYIPSSDITKGYLLVKLIIPEPMEVF